LLRNNLFLIAVSVLHVSVISSAVMEVTAWIKNHGNLPANTLDLPMFTALGKALASITTGITFDMFAHTSTSRFPDGYTNSFVPGKTPPIAHTCGKQYHHAFLRDPVDGVCARAGYSDLRNVWDKEVKVAVTHVDPPYTPLQQKDLYGGAVSSAMRHDLLLDSHSSIEELYRIAVDMARDITTDIIVVYGYKVPEIHGFGLTGILVAGGGSGHPAILACIYTSREFPELKKVLRECLGTTVQEREVEVQRDHDMQFHDTFSDMLTSANGDFNRLPMPNPMSDQKIRVILPAKADDYKMMKCKRRWGQSPPHHPSFLSLTNEYLYRVSLAGTPVHVITRQIAMYGEVFKKDPSRHKMLWGKNPPMISVVIVPRGWGDAVFQILI
jgi:hypothetical protein